MQHFFNYIIFFLLLSSFVNAQSNSPFSNRGSSRSGATPGKQEPYVEDIDTFGVFYIFADNPSQSYVFQDTGLVNFHQYSPILQQEVDFAHLGNLGSAHRPLVFQPEFRKGLDIGLHQYDLYQFKPEQVRYHRLEKAFTQISYSQGAEQSDGYIKAKFSRNFAHGVNLSIDYKKINQLGIANQYPHQNGRNTALNLGLWLQSKNKKYDGFFSYITNTIEQEDNGGLRIEPETGNVEFSSPSTAEIFLTQQQARTRYHNKNFSYTQYYKLSGVGADQRAFTLSHQLAYDAATYKFSDTRPDSSYYLHFQVIERGLRHFIAHKKVSNTFKISTFRLRKEDKKVRQQKDLIEVGLVHDLHFLNQEPLDSTLSNLFLTGRINFNPNSNLKINTYVHLGILANAGDYRLSGELFYNLKKIGSLKIKAINQLYAPTLLEERFFVSQQNIWKNNFKKTISTSLSATLHIPKTRSTVSVQNHLLNNYIYYDTLSIPQQSEIAVNVLQLIGQQDFVLGKIHLDNSIVLQQVTGGVLRLPSFYTKHQLYFGGYLFKKALKVQIGTQLRINNDFLADTYHPLTGQFRLISQHESGVTLYPALDAFFSMRVKTFRAFVKAENLTDLFSDQFFYQTTYYPEPVFFIRFGISWQFVN